MNRAAVAALLLSLWSITVPALGRVLGLNVEVGPRVEVADHVIPGIVSALASVAALALLGRGGDEGVAVLFAAGVVALAGLWMTTTHIPLVVQAARAQVPWDAALWHSSGGPAVLGLGVALFVMRPEGVAPGKDDDGSRPVAGEGAR